MNDRPPVNERIARRRAEVRTARRRRRLRRTLTVLVLVALAVGFVLLERSSLVALADVEVVGLERLEASEVVTAAGLREGMSVLRIRRGQVQERVEELPLVAQASVERVGALGLRIRVEEEAPALTARFPAGSVLVTADGAVVGTGEAPGTLVVEVPGPAASPGSSVEDVPALAAAHEVLLGLPGPLEALVGSARARTEDDVRLLLEDGIEVLWGGATRNDEKARALGAVLEDLGTRRVSSIDVRAPMAPTVTP